MVYRLKELEKVKKIFEGWDETLIWSCLQNVMGKIYLTDKSSPKSAMAILGCFAFFAGEPDKELVTADWGPFVIMTPQNEDWAKLIESSLPNASKETRYAIKKNTVFDRNHLSSIVSSLKDGYEIKRIDSELYDECLSNPMFEDFVSVFESKEQYLAIGRGFVITKDGKIVSGASSYSRYLDGIEIEVDTLEEERRKGLASIACSKLILSCLDDGLYPSWDAANNESVKLAEKLGYEFSHEYSVYCVSRT